MKSRDTKRRAARMLMLTAAALSTTVVFAGPSAHARVAPAAAVLSARLTGAAEVDGTGAANQGDTDGRGLAVVTVEAPGATSFAANLGARAAGGVCITATAVDITTVTAAHIHKAAAGSNGPIVVPIGQFSNGWASGCTAVDAAVSADIAANPAQYYVNLHTADFPNGALRGQLAPTNTRVYTAALNGTVEVNNAGVFSQGDVDGTGQATILVDPTGLVCVDIAVFDILTPSAAHIHQAGFAANGPIVVNLVAPAVSPAGGFSTACTTVSATVAGAIAADPNGFYVNVHNSQFPAGAVRGQVVLKNGYRLNGGDGGVFVFGDDAFFGSTGDLTLNRPVVGMAPTANGNGYWFVASDGGIFAYGDAPFFGSASSAPLARPIVAMASTPTGRGYWLVASDGGLFAFGDAPFLGSLGGVPLNKPIIAIASSGTGKGYWMLAGDGGVFAFGDAPFLGSGAAFQTNGSIVGMAVTPTGRGYTMVTSKGQVLNFGDSPLVGALADSRVTSNVVGVISTPTGRGFTLFDDQGRVAGFGDAPQFGDMGGTKLAKPVIAGIL